MITSPDDHRIILILMFFNTLDPITKFLRPLSDLVEERLMLKISDYFGEKSSLKKLKRSF